MQISRYGDTLGGELSDSGVPSANETIVVVNRTAQAVVRH